MLTTTSQKFKPLTFNISLAEVEWKQDGPGEKEQEF